MTTEQMEQDLAYVRQAVERREPDSRTPLGVALIWTGFSLVGFTWLDFQPERAWWFLVLAAPVAFLASMLVGRTANWKLGEFDQLNWRREWAHWGSLFVAGAAVMSMAFAGRIGGDPLGQVILIMLGLVYFLDGVHSSVRLFVWMGLLMMVGAAVMTYVDRWGWTTVGVLLSIGLIASSFVGGPRHARE